MNDQLPAEQMTPLERIRAFKAGKAYDRIPCGLNVTAHAARVTGIKVSEYFLSADKMVEAQIAAYRKYRTESVGAHPNIVEAIGAKVVYPEQSTPYVAEAVIKDFSDLDKLEPPNPLKAKPLAVFWEAMRRLVDEVGNEVPVSIGITGPFGTAAYLRGIEFFLRDLYKNPEFAHKLLRFSLDSIIPVIEEAGKLGVSFGIFEPTSSGSVISAKQYREFAFPYQKELVEVMKRCGPAAPMLHICGNTKRIWTDMVHTGAGILSLDNEVDMAEAKAAVGDLVPLMGNVHPTQTMLFGTERDVFENVRQCLLKAYNSPKGYVLALGCGLPINTPPENIHALVSAAGFYGKYPIKPDALA